MPPVKHSGPSKLRPLWCLTWVSDLHNPCLRTEGDKLSGGVCELVAVSSFVPEAYRSCSVGKHKSPDRTDNGLTGLPGDSLCTHTHLNKSGWKTARTISAKVYKKSRLPCLVSECWFVSLGAFRLIGPAVHSAFCRHKQLPSKRRETFKEMRLGS